MGSRELSIAQAAPGAPARGKQRFTERREEQQRAEGEVRPPQISGRHTLNRPFLPQVEVDRLDESEVRCLTRSMRFGILERPVELAVTVGGLPANIETCPPRSREQSAGNAREDWGGPTRASARPSSQRLRER